VSATGSIEALVNDRAILGESPVWSQREGALYWLDTRGQKIYRMHLASGKREQWDAPAKPSALAVRRSGGLIVAMKTGIAFLDMARNAWTPVVVPPDLPEHRTNDGKVDRAGRFWFGSMNEEARPGAGTLYRLDADHKLNAIEAGWTLPNGVGWSPDDTRMYFGDTGTRTMYVYDFDLASGTARNKRPFAQIPEPDGMNDGATVDSAGYVWIARVDGWALLRYAPDGTLDRTLELPLRRPTSVIFGGDDLKTLFVTTATRALSDEELQAQPLAGAVLAIRVDVPGLPETDYAG
jgi:L-arabinonolactonase